MRIAFFILTISALITSCTKNNFDDDAEVLVGRWECVMLQDIDYSNSPWIDTAYHQPPIKLEIEFVKRGRICLYDGSERIASTRVKEVQFQTDDLTTVYIDCSGLREYVFPENTIVFDVIHQDSISSSAFNFILYNYGQNRRVYYHFARMH